MSKPATPRTYWCDSCQVPLLGELCCACGAKGRNISAATLVPVFRPEINYLRNNIDEELHASLREFELWVTPANYNYHSQGKAFFKLSATSADVAITKIKPPHLPTKRTRKETLDQLRESNRAYVEQHQRRIRLGGPIDSAVL